VSDWKRHKRKECITKSTSKVEYLGTVKRRIGDYQNAFDKMAAGIERVVGDQGNRRLPILPNQTGSERKMHDFTLRFYLQLTSFAAYHIERFHPLKGSLFVFSKVTYHDLMNVPRDLGVAIHSKLDRSFAIAWGCQPIDWVGSRPHFSWMDLAEKLLSIFHGWTLQRSS